MKNYKLEIEYDGSRYQGWQRLGKGESGNTISNKLLEVIEKLTNEKVELFCGARTEVGVHAHLQTANFKTGANLTPLEVKRYLNRYLPMDIAVLNVEIVPERFHAALNAVSKTYLYRIVTADVPNVFERKYTYYNFRKLDVDAMKQAALLLAGKHDFKNFSTAKRAKSSTREITGIDIYDDGDEIQITITANDFLHNMARLIIGTLIDIGNGNRKADTIDSIFFGSESPAEACDAKGLYLESVTYPKEA
ncbi:MAG: tRNA pseudouridine(38-40) synthase TruA [Hespellia sp.]|nr:tRNA pseudouridine(38-40) synthase TruA [Hespellia sp.]